MKRIAPLAASLSLGGFLAWLVLTVSLDSGSRRPAETTGDSPVERSAASAVPCVAPLTWRIPRLDPGFGLDDGRARAAVEEAALLWERASGRKLFAFHPEGEVALRFMYGERQRRGEEERRREEELDRDLRRLDARRDELSARKEAFAADRSSFEARVRDFRARRSKHNAEVRRRNRSSGASEEVVGALRRSEVDLRAEGGALERERRSLDARGRALRRDEERLASRVRAHRRRVEALERRFPVRPVEAAAYREALRREDGRVVVRREIRIYRFEDREDLVRVLAHEMGHAQGLGHASTAGVLMSERYGAGGSPGPAAVTEADLELLQERCPAA